MIWFSFLFFLVGVTGTIGLLASRKRQSSERDYFLAGQNVSPYILAFSSCASKYSGFMFAGMMGAAYSDGTSVVWLGLGLLLGSFLVYAFVAIKLQEFNTGGWALSIAELLSFGMVKIGFGCEEPLAASPYFFLWSTLQRNSRPGGKHCRWPWISLFTWG